MHAKWLTCHYQKEWRNSLRRVVWQHDQLSGSDGFQLSADFPSGPTAGYDPLMKTLKRIKKKERGADGTWTNRRRCGSCRWMVSLIIWQSKKNTESINTGSQLPPRQYISGKEGGEPLYRSGATTPPERNWRAGRSKRISTTTSYRVKELKPSSMREPRDWMVMSLRSRAWWEDENRTAWYKR